MISLPAADNSQILKLFAGQNVSVSFSIPEMLDNREVVCFVAAYSNMQRASLGNREFFKSNALSEQGMTSGLLRLSLFSFESPLSWTRPFLSELHTGFKVHYGLDGADGTAFAKTEDGWKKLDQCSEEDFAMAGYDSHICG